MYPEVEEYFRTYKSAEREYTMELRQAQFERETSLHDARWAAEDAGRRFDEYNNETDRQAVRASLDAYREAERAAERKLRGANPARDLLLKSEHPMVRWIAEHCLFADQGSEVEGHARTILQALPATNEELWKLAKDDHGMCDAFDRFYEAAERDGMFNNGNPPVAWKERAAMRNWIRRNYGSGYVRDLEARMDRVIKAIDEHHAKVLADAKAEWQGLDEARRSESARRAAATRRANAVATSEDVAEATAREILAKGLTADDQELIAPARVSLTHPSRFVA